MLRVKRSSLTTTNTVTLPWSICLVSLASLGKSSEELVGSLSRWIFLISSFYSSAQALIFWVCSLKPNPSGVSTEVFSLMYPYTDMKFFYIQLGLPRGLSLRGYPNKKGSPTWVNDVNDGMVLSGNLSFYETTRYSLKEVRRVKSIPVMINGWNPIEWGFSFCQILL